MEYSGYVQPGAYDEVVFRGDVDRREFIASWFGLGHGQVLADISVNVWEVNDTIEALVRTRHPVDKKALRDPETPLEWLTGH
jgi:3-phenylpropionate/trans-cinnamate dioxygenase ferredoxin reductase subunit